MVEFIIFISALCEVKLICEIQYNNKLLSRLRQFKFSLDKYQMTQFRQEESKNILAKLRNTYEQFKHLMQKNPSALGNVPTVQWIQGDGKKRIRQKKTRSKSRNKEISIQRSGRKCQRLIKNCNKVSEYEELNKEPLWHPKRRNKRSKQKIERQGRIERKQFENLRVKRNDPLYQFASQYSGSQQSGQKQKNQKVSKSSLIEDDKERGNNKRLEQDNVDDWLINQAQSRGWEPNKEQKSMLACQGLIDEYFMFRSNLRQSQVTKIDELINYVQNIKGFYFNIGVLNKIIGMNPSLYTKFSMDEEKYLKCERITVDEIQRRQILTKLKMIKKSQIQQKED